MDVMLLFAPCRPERYLDVAARNDMYLRRAEKSG